ncbi:MAG TPA: TadE/TadG family type IV pilus assembly protein [Vicinamibacterales bacterium]|jgi:Flp pilus assembly protein TadG|nr:TadE/TadG family type IV pilus assembly protein [Vicinamibacterales bacterium]
MKMKRIRNEKGAALLEAAITVPIILLISVGIFEFGRAYQTWQVLTNASREGARMAVITGSTDAAVTQRVRDYMQAGSLPNYATAPVTIQRNVALTGADTASQIQIDYPFQFMVLNPVVRLISPQDTTTGAPITMRSSALMRNES